MTAMQYDARATKLLSVLFSLRVQVMDVLSQYKCGHVNTKPQEEVSNLLSRANRGLLFKILHFWEWKGRASKPNLSEQGNDPCLGRHTVENHPL